MIDLDSEFIDFYNLAKSRLEEIGLSPNSYPLDHVCYRVSNQEEYDIYLKLFISRSVLYTKKYFHERDFHAFVLKVPFQYKDATFNYLEFAQPGGSDMYDCGFQHIEFITNDNWTDILDEETRNRLLFKSSNGEEYLKWKDKVAIKLTDTPQITKALLEDDSEIIVSI